MKNKVMYLVLVILIILVVLLVGNNINMNNRMSVIEKQDNNASQLGETTSSNAYITTAEHLAELGNSLNKVQLWENSNVDSSISKNTTISLNQSLDNFIGIEVIWTQYKGIGQYCLTSTFLFPDNYDDYIYELFDLRFGSKGTYAETRDFSINKDDHTKIIFDGGYAIQGIKESDYFKNDNYVIPIKIYGIK